MKSACTLLAAALALAAPPVAAHKAHQHGVIKLDVALQGEELTLVVEMPLDSLLGFERAPRTDGERQAAAAALARMRDGAALFKPDAAARCTLVTAKVEAPVLEGAGGAAAGNAGRAGAEEHADLDASYLFKCAQPALLRVLDVGLFDAFRRVQRIEVQVAAPQGQSKAVLRRPARELRLQR